MSFFLRLDIEILHFEHVSLTLREGKPAWFEVNVKSNTSCNVKWFHDGNLITTSSTRFTMTSVRKENGTSSHTLHTASVLPRDGGKLQETFRCTVQFFIPFLFIKIEHPLLGFVRRMENHCIKSGDICNKKLDSYR